MPSFTQLLLVALAALAPSVSAHLDETIYPFHPPRANDSRSPCPGLNALANQGLLPRDGRNIDLETLITGAYLGYSLAASATTIVGTVGLKASTTGNASTFHLGDLAVHSPQVIEHDGSMTREDAYFGDANTFSHTAYARTLASWGNNETITFAVAAAERSARFACGAAHNPQFNATFANSGSLLEYSLALSSFGDVTEGNGNATLIKYLFEHERLPTALGWQRSETNITAQTALAMSAKIAALLT